MIYFMVLIYLLKSAADGVYVSFPTSSSDSDISEFNHLAVDPVLGTVFVGARNHLHQLNADLQLVRSVMTGPRLDNRLCTESFGETRCGAGGSTVFDAIPTDNINKVHVSVFL